MIEYNITLHITSEEMNELTDHIKAEGVSPEIWFKRAVCSFTEGLMFSSDDVWWNTEGILIGFKQHVSALPVSRQTKLMFVAFAKNKILPAFSPSQINEMDVSDIADAISEGKGHCSTTTKHNRYYIREFKKYLSGVCAA